MLRLFDVSDRAAPELTFSHEFDYGITSEASIDHRAFTFFTDRNLLAIPFSGWDYDASIERQSRRRARRRRRRRVLGGGVRSTAPRWFRRWRRWSCSWDSAYRSRLERAAFIGDFVYGAARSGIVSGALDDLAADPTVLALPAKVRRRGEAPAARVQGGASGTSGSGGFSSGSTGSGSGGFGGGSGGAGGTGGTVGTGRGRSGQRLIGGRRSGLDVSARRRARRASFARGSRRTRKWPLP